MPPSKSATGLPPHSDVTQFQCSDGTIELLILTQSLTRKHHNLNIIRPNRMHRDQRYIVVCVTVCVRACWIQAWALQKRGTDRLPFGLFTRVGSRNVLGGGPDPPPGEGAILGIVLPHWVSKWNFSKGKADG